MLIKIKNRIINTDQMAQAVFKPASITQPDNILNVYFVGTLAGSATEQFNGKEAQALWEFLDNVAEHAVAS